MRLKNKMVYNGLKKIKEEDFFSVLINRGNLKISGLDKNLIPYRIIEYQGKDFKLILKPMEAID